ncbi:hypothetical protein R6V09_35155 [Streptomyces sp. W16]|uniref:hypothetical protein n=1 Tax=Streptomyces sp. W16 TaxID=3076631 RepID=UPI00295C2BF8|nr:hypothetical protein [Streptomyces sp. W16]MDV9175337.1 hypothetical protein [Streptomyces sp. W16]
MSISGATVDVSLAVSPFGPHPHPSQVRGAGAIRGIQAARAARAACAARVVATPS